MNSAAVTPNYELRVGMFTVIALILLLWGWGWLKNITFRPPQRFIVQFHDVAGLNKNATVNINGVRVGIVEDIDLKAKGQVFVHARVTAPNVVVTKGSKFTIQTLGLVGAKYLEVTLPEELPGEPPPPPLQPDEVVIGQDPVRVELVMNDIATSISAVIRSARSDQFQKRWRDTLLNLNQASAKLNKNMDHFTRAADALADGSDQLGEVAERAKPALANAGGFFNQGTRTMRDIDILSTELRGTNQRVNTILEKPINAADLKQTMDRAKEVADQIAVATHEINTTLADPATRKDLITIMDKLSQSTQNVQNSVSTVQGLANDKQLRGELRDNIIMVNNALSQLGPLLNNPAFQSNLQDTMCKVNKTSQDLDYAARQIQQILGKKHPLLKMMFGQPGKLNQPPPPANAPCPPAVQPNCPPGTVPTQTTSPLKAPLPAPAP